MFSKRYRIILVICVIGIVLGVLAGLGFDRFSSSSVPISGNSLSLKEQNAYWTDQIRRLGPQAAINNFKKTYSEKDKNSHGYMHLFATLLYKRLGFEGIKYCDNTYASGCFHGFFIASLNDQGEDSILKLGKECDKLFPGSSSGCQHGIGHGLLEYFGAQNIDKALGWCKKLSWNGKIMGCSSGVFMEYGHPVAVNDGTIIGESPDFDPKDIFRPCSRITIYKESCYHELPDYLIRVFKYDYAQVGQICSKVQDSNYKKYCFLGIGYASLPYVDFNPETAIAACERMPDEASQLLCRIGASEIFADDKRTALGDADSICEGLSDQDRAVCLNRYSTGIIR